MDAEAYLRKRGWGGPGSALQPSKPTSLKRPLLVAKKVDVLGLGLSKSSVSDQWWLRAFDDSLQAFGTGRKGMLADVAKHGTKRGGLYGNFVKGEGLKGTIPEAEEQTRGKRKRDGGKEVKSKKVKSDEEDKVKRRAAKKGLSVEAYLASRGKSLSAPTSAVPSTAPSAEATETDTPDDQVSRLAAQILARSRIPTATSSDATLPTVEVSTTTGPFSAREEKAARKAARQHIRSQREARRAKRVGK